MLLATDLDQLEMERVAIWELFADLLDFDLTNNPNNAGFTAKQLSKELPYTKSELNKLLFRLYLQKALEIQGKTTSGATIYNLNNTFLTTE